MDSKLKSAITAICIFTVLTVLVIALAAGSKKTERPGVSSSSKEDTVVSEHKDTKQIGNNTSAWIKDETFFDSDEDTLAMKILQNSLTLHVKAVSMEKDLRIRVLDYEEQVKTGEKFILSIKATGNESLTYEDEDLDGVVYAENLLPGEYEVSLLPLGDYIVPDLPIKVKVRDKVAYEKIEDIGLLFKEKTEAEVSLDDLMTVSSLDYADKKQDTAYAKDEVAYGVDVSEKDGEIDWKKVYDSGIRFAMIRAGFRGAITGDIILDEKFQDNATAAIRAGLNVGAYFFSQAVNEKEAVEEASALIECCKERNINYPVTIRIDQAGGLGRADSIDSELRTQVAEAFLKTVKNAGYDPCVYASSNWLMTNLDSKKLSKYTVWMSQLNKQPTDELVFDMWQYTTKGKVPGIQKEVSISRSYK